ncbi:MAG: RHS repeat-associated core domain-containing protein [Bryobacteraceae bacterium]
MLSGVTYGIANEVLTLTANTSFANNETRGYNSLFQLTQLTVGAGLSMQYAYSGTQNNGKITSQTDVLSGEQVVYTYDSLNRLATAQTADNPSVTQWGQSYNYDGFGNLTDQNVIKGSAPSMHVVYNASTNRQTGDTADANGNIGSGYLYDIENRLLRPGASSTVQYGYDAGNKRVWRGDTGVDEFAFFAGNQKLATYTLAVSGTSVRHTLTSTNVYFGGRMIGKGTYNSGGTNDKVTVASVAQDRLGSMNGKFYPYGQERPSATANDKEKFTGYYRDASTGLDYADQRYHQSGVGRFMTPDYYWRSANPFDPGSINRYAYVGGDPLNRIDPQGLDWFDPDTNTVHGDADDMDLLLACEAGYASSQFLGICTGGTLSSGGTYYHHGGGAGVGGGGGGGGGGANPSTPAAPGDTTATTAPTEGPTTPTSETPTTVVPPPTAPPAEACNAACRLVNSLGGMWNAVWGTSKQAPTTKPAPAPEPKPGVQPTQAGIPEVLTCSSVRDCSQQTLTTMCGSSVEDKILHAMFWGTVVWGSKGALYGSVEPGVGTGIGTFVGAVVGAGAGAISGGALALECRALGAY